MKTKNVVELREQTRVELTRQSGTELFLHVGGVPRALDKVRQVAKAERSKITVPDGVMAELAHLLVQVVGMLSNEHKRHVAMPNLAHVLQ